MCPELRFRIIIWVGISHPALHYIESIYITSLAVGVRNPWQTIIYCSQLAGESAVSGAFASYPHPGGQGPSRTLTIHCIL